jgi:leader peptidase (prepilin peptidase)/N-methyltransferase
LSAGLEVWLATGVLLVVAMVASLVPGRLMREALDGGWTRGDGWRLVGTAFLAGLLVRVGLFETAAGFDGATAGALAVCGVVLTAVLVLDAKALVVADLHVVGLLLLAFVGPLAPPWREALAGAVVGGGLLWAVRWAFRRARGVEGLGLGDVKLMVALGALTGPERVLWIIVTGALLGLAWGLVRSRRGKGGGEGEAGGVVAVPLAAASALPALAVLLLGAPRP